MRGFDVLAFECARIAALNSDTSLLEPARETANEAMELSVS